MSITGTTQKCGSDVETAYDVVGIASAAEYTKSRQDAGVTEVQRSLWKSAGSASITPPLLQILCEPTEESLVPQLAILRLQHPVTLVGEEEQL